MPVAILALDRVMDRPNIRRMRGFYPLSAFRRRPDEKVDLQLGIGLIFLQFHQYAAFPINRHICGGEFMRPDHKIPQDSLYGHSSNLQGARAWMANVCGPHNLDVLGRGQLSFRHSGHVLRSMSTTVGCVEYGTDVAIGIDASNPLNCFSISLPLVGEQELAVRGRVIRSDAAQGIVVAPNEEQELTIAGNCRKLQVAINRSVMHSVLESMLQRPMDKPLVFDGISDASGGGGASWWHLIKHMFADMENPSSLYRDPTLSAEVENSLIKGFLLSHSHNYLPELQQRRLADCPPHVMRLRQFLVDNAKEDVTLHDIDQVAGVSRTKACSDFKRHFGVTPLVYLRQHRLKQVRQEIARAGSSKYVSVIAMDWGFTHLGRFSSEYKEFFGELPSATARRNRGPYCAAD